MNTKNTTTTEDSKLTPFELRVSALMEDAEIGTARKIITIALAEIEETICAK